MGENYQILKEIQEKLFDAKSKLESSKFQKSIKNSNSEDLKVEFDIITTLASDIVSSSEDLKFS